MRAFAKRQIYLSVLFLVLSLTLFLAIYLYASRTISNRQEHLMSLEIENVEVDISRFYDEYFFKLEDISDYISMFGTDDLLEFLIEIKGHHEDMESIYFGTVDNVMYNSRGFTPSPEFDLRTRIWYQLAVNENRSVLTPAFLNATQDT